MKYSVSFLLLLALAASNCNGQMEGPGQRPPSRPAPQPGNPNARPAPQGPPRGPATNNQTPNAPVPRPNPQQNRVPPPQTRPNPAPQPNAPNAPAPRPVPQQNPPRTPPNSNAATTRGPAVSVQTRQPGNGNTATQRTTTTVRGTTVRTTTRANNAPDNNSSPAVNIPTDRPDSYPTAPTIAPPPQVHFPDQNPQNPQFPQMPTFPGGRVGEGRMDARCPRNLDARNPIQFGHESNCAAFFRCGENGFAFEHRCPEGMHWNSARVFCDLPGNAGCQSGGPIARPQPQPQPQPPVNNQPRYVHPIVIPMAPRT